MKGRIEKDNKVKEKTLKRLEGQPDIISSYYYSMSDKTALTKDNYIRQIISFLKDINFSGDIKQLEAIRSSDINRYLEKIATKDGAEKRKSDRYVATIYFSISNFFDFLVKDDYLTSNICKRISPPHARIETTPTYLTEEELQLVIQNINKTASGRWKSRDLLIFILGCTTGLRISSIIELNVEDVDLERNVITVTEKGNKTRECKIGSKTAELFKEWFANRQIILDNDNVKDLDAVFISKYNNRISIGAMEKLIHKYTSFLGKHITPHKLRHTCGTLLFQKKGNIKLVQEVLGHKNIANTMIYTHISDEMMQEAANTMDTLF